MRLTKLRLFLKLIIFAVLLSGSFSIAAQDNLLVNTIDKANKMRDDGDFDQAADILKEYNNQYPGNIWIQRLYAETLFWLQDYDESVFVYEAAVKTHPNDFDVKYEFATMLFNQGEYHRAQELLLVYTNKYPEVAEAEFLLGITYYYLGDFLPAAEHLERSLELNPGNERTAQLLMEVHSITNPWVKASFAYNDDSQNIIQLSPVIEGGMYKSSILSPSFYLDLQNFSADSTNSNQINFLVRNSFILSKIGFKAKVGVGLNYASNMESTDFLWDIVLQQKIGKNINLLAMTRRSSYIYTIAAVNDPFLSNKYSISMEWKKQRSWWVKAGYLAETFPDANYVQTLFAWALAPSIKFSIFDLRFGYAFNYANSNESRYVTVDEKKNIIKYPEDKKIEGVYNPYFTPNNQFSNSALGIVLIAPSPRINIKLYATVGFYSRTMNPYFYVDYNNDGKLGVKKDYYQESFTPMDLGIDLNFDLSNNLYLNLSYNYFQTFYYNSDNIELGLKMYLK